jgi:hypothetical protein
LKCLDGIVWLCGGLVGQYKAADVVCCHQSGLFEDLLWVLIARSITRSPCL